MFPPTHWLAMMDINNDFYVLASPDGKVINSFRSKENALQFFTDTYTQACLNGREGIDFALKIYTTLQPRVVGVTLDTITKRLFNEEDGIYSIKLDESLGDIQVLKCNRPIEIVKKIYDSGEMPEFKHPSFQQFLN